MMCFAASFAAAAATADGLCPDGMCAAPAAPQSAELTVYRPAPVRVSASIKPAPRLKTLDGKTIALAGGSFMASVTHSELKRLILAEYPKAKVYLPGEIGSAGPYPRPGVVRREKEEFQRRLKSLGVDAVVSGNGGCGLCTPKETGSCIAAEVLGIPSVMIAGTGFVKQARNPLGSRAVANYYGNPGSAFDPAAGSFARHEAAIAREENAKETPTPPWLEWTGLETMTTVAAMETGKNIFLVTGDPARNKEQCVPGGGSATVKITLPKAWDSLMAARGYAPLSDFLIKTDLRPDAPRPKVRGYSRPGVRGDNRRRTRTPSRPRSPTPTRFSNS